MMHARQRGAALITAMLVVAIASVAAVEMASRQQYDIRRAANVFESSQAYLFALGVEGWAVEALRRDAADSQTDHTGEDWAAELPAIAVEGAMVAGRVEDMQGRFNINNLINDLGEHSVENIARFKRLLLSLELDDEVVMAVVDWLDADEEISFPAGAEDNEYLGADVPHRTGNTAMVSVSELRQIQGMTNEMYQALIDHVSTLPRQTDINVNTATANVLVALVDGLSLTEAEQIISEREDEPFETVDSFAKHGQVKDRLKSNDGINISSDFFMIRGQVQYGKSRVQHHALVERRDGKVKVIQRNRGSI